MPAAYGSCSCDATYQIASMMETGMWTRCAAPHSAASGVVVGIPLGRTGGRRGKVSMRRISGAANIDAQVSRRRALR
jgi:hypothetical protein